MGRWALWRNGGGLAKRCPDRRAHRSGVELEQYWFTRHEAVYRWLAGEVLPAVATGPLLDAGCGEGYGADLLARQTSRPCVGLDLDRATIAHVGRATRRCMRSPGIWMCCRCGRSASPAWCRCRSSSTCGTSPASCGNAVACSSREDCWRCRLRTGRCSRRGSGGARSRPIPSTSKSSTPRRWPRCCRPPVLEDVQVLGLHHGPVIGDREAAHGSIIDAHGGRTGDVGCPSCWSLLHD